jgi:hypothetical protein
MRLLYFDSRVQNVKYRDGVHQQRLQLLGSTVVCPARFVTAAVAA